MKRSIIVAALCTLFLSGCTQQESVVEPAAEQAGAVNPQVQALEQAEQAGLLEDDSGMLSEEEAMGRVSAPLDEELYTVELTDETLSVGGEDGQAHEYFVFAVSHAAGEPVGRIAIDRETGEKYYYLGDGVLEDYTSFPLYDAEAEEQAGWPGTYVNASGLSLTVTQEEEGAFAYAFSDGTEGTAAVTGETAKSADGEINFLLANKVVTVAGGGLTGNYTAQ